MARDLKLGIRLSADGKGFVGEIRLARGELNKLVGRTERAGKANKGYARSARDSATANRRLGQSFQTTHGAAAKYLGLIGGAVAFKQAASGALRTADAYTELTNRLRLVSEGEANLTQVRGELFDISQRTRTAFAANATLYSRLSLATDALGRSQDDVLKATELLNQQLAIGGSTGQEAAAGLIQFAQGLASGRLQGDELRSVMENLLGVSEGLIVGFAKLREQGQIEIDVTRENIRELAAEGTLSANLLLDAVLASAADTEEKFAKVAVLVSAANTMIANSITKLIGELDTGSGVSAQLVKGLTGVSTAIDAIDAAELSADLEDIVTVGGYLLLGFLGKATVGFSAYAFSQARAAAANMSFAASAVSANRRTVVLARSLNLTQAATARLAIGMRAATLASRGLRASLAFLTGPAGLLFLAGYAAYEFATANEAVAESATQAAEDLDTLKAQLAELVEKGHTATLTIKRDALLTGIDTVKAKLDAAQGALDALSDGVKTVTQTVVVNPAFDEAGNFSWLGAMAQPYVTTIEVEVAVDDEELLPALQAVQQLTTDLADNEASLQAYEDALASVGNTAATAARQFDAFGVALDAGEDFTRLQQSLRTELEKINATYAEQAEKINADTQAGSAAQAELRRRIEVQRDAATAALARKAAEEQARQAQASGLPALALLAERNAELAQVTDFSAEALRRQADRTRIAADVQNHYRDATQATIQALIEARVQEAALLRIQELKTQAFETVKGAQLRYAEETAALEALRGDAQTDQGLIEIELERLKAEQILEVKRGYWEQELLEAEGFRSRAAAAALAHKERLIAIESRYAQRVGQVQALIARYEATKGTERLQTGLEIAKQSAANFAGQSQTAFRISQAAAIAQAILATHKGITEALGSGPPPANFIQAALVGAAGAAEIAAIRSQPPPQGFARGGIIDSPTFFSARNVPRGVAGEAGPEAILPVTRMRSGGFGVDAASAGNTVHLSFTPVIQVSAPSETEDPAEFGQSLALQLRRSLEPWLNQWARDQHRAGGVFNPTDRV